MIVSDIGMPGMDGYEFIRELRSRAPERGGHVAALALTAFARLEDVARARANGYDGHIGQARQPEGAGDDHRRAAAAHRSGRHATSATGGAHREGGGTDLVPCIRVDDLRSAASLPHLSGAATSS